MVKNVTVRAILVYTMPEPAKRPASADVTPGPGGGRAAAADRRAPAARAHRRGACRRRARDASLVTWCSTMPETAHPGRALSHIKVVDLTRARSGPTCVRQLSEMGAQVIKVEALGRRRRRHRRSPRLRLPEHPPQQAQPDAEPQAPGWAARSCCGWSSTPTCWSRTSGRTSSTGWGSTTRRWRKINPRLVYGSISGLWPDRPVQRPARARPDRPGTVRPDDRQRRARSRPDARRPAGRRPDGRLHARATASWRR